MHGVMVFDVSVNSIFPFAISELIYELLHVGSDTILETVFTQVVISADLVNFMSCSVFYVQSKS